MPGSTGSYRKMSMLKSKLLIFFRDVISLLARVFKLAKRAYCSQLVCVCLCMCVSVCHWRCNAWMGKWDVE